MNLGRASTRPLALGALCQTKQGFRKKQGEY